MRKFVSFGYDQPGGTPTAHLTLDVRHLFQDPHGVSQEMREMTGRDQAVIDNVLEQPGAREYIAMVADLVERLAALLPGIDLVVAIGCVGGRHRGPVFADALETELFLRLCTEDHCPTIGVVHRDIDRPVIGRLPDYPPNGTTLPGFP